jgi:predicted ATPase/class 3 adenylate cyclase
MAGLPSGTVTFLFTDLEGSTRLWEQHPDAMRPALASHDAIVREAIEAHGGFVVKTTGDGFHAAFRTAHDAVDAAIAAQLALASEGWTVTGPLKVRMGLHTCEAELRDGDYYGSAVNRAARLMSAAHGGQVVVSAATSELVRGGAVELVDLGEHRLRDLGEAERVFQIAHPELEREFPALLSVNELVGNLPVQPNRFVGRSASIEQIRGLVVDTAVVTLTGPGGVGKTRLGLQVAAVLQPEFADGAWLVDLAPVKTAERVVALVLETLGYKLAAREDDVEGLCARLRRRHLLLVLDNCEHLVASVATVVDAISSSAPDVRMIATSREGLGVPAERVVPVTPLGTDAGGEAVELFVARARAARPDFTLDATTTPTVVELCRRLDGIPLAIELAAARTRSIAPAKVLERLDERFRMLTGGSRTAVARHQTLQAAVDWSYELLSHEESRVLDRLSVFAGGFALDAAETVASDDDIDAFDVLEHVSALVDKSLVVADPGEETYRLLETIRQYAAARLAASGSAHEVRARHAHYYRSVAAEIWPNLAGPGELAAYERLSANIENLRLMLDWYRDDQQAVVVADVIWALSNYWWWLGHQLEMIGRLEETVGSLGEDHLRLSRVHSLLAWMKSGVGFVGVPEHAEQSATQAELAGIPTPVLTLSALGTYFMTFGGDSERAVEQTRLAVAAARAIGDDYLAVYFRLVGLTYTALIAPGTDDTLRLAEEIRGDVERAGSDALRQMWLQGAAVALLPVDAARALAFLDEALNIATRENLQDGVATTEFWRGILFFTRRRHADAAAAWRHALVVNHDRGNRRGITNVLSCVTGLADRTGRSHDAALLLAGLRAARDEFGLPGSANERYAEQRIDEHLRERTRSQDAALGGRQLDVEATIDRALDTLNEITTDASTSISLPAQ